VDLDGLLKSAMLRARTSAAEGQALLDAGFPEPAYVWAFRSIEIYVKEVMLLPLFLEAIPGDDWEARWTKAWRRIAETFDSGRWSAALRKVDEIYGPLDKMVTESGEDVWQVWKSVVVPRRGDIVHGRPVEPAVSAADAAIVLLWAEQMIAQLSMRLIAAGQHPFHGSFVAALEKAKQSVADAASPSEQSGEQ
jgi:hypothetical protein